MNTQRISTITPNEPIRLWTLPFTAHALTYVIDEPPTEKELETICLQIGYLSSTDQNANQHFVIVFPRYNAALFLMPKRGLTGDLTKDDLPAPFKDAKERIVETAQKFFNRFDKPTAQ